METVLDEQEAERLLTQRLRGNFEGPNVVLAAPRLEKVQSLIDTGSNEKVTLVWTTQQYFKNVSIEDGKIVVQTEISFETIELSHLHNLRVESDWKYVFYAVDLTMHDRLPGSRSQSYSHTVYEITIGLTSPDRMYRIVGSGQGTQWDDMPPLSFGHVSQR